MMGKTFGCVDILNVKIFQYRPISGVILSTFINGIQDTKIVFVLTIMSPNANRNKICQNKT